MNKVPPIVIDLGLNDWYEGGYKRVKGKKRQKLLEEEHTRLHKEGTAHINLDDTYDKGNNGY